MVATRKTKKRNIFKRNWHRGVSQVLPKEEFKKMDGVRENWRQDTAINDDR